MLKDLFLKNLVLVEEATLRFESGFTIITGETGSGKTALTEALRLLLGERADTSKVRKGCEKALIRASFNLPKRLFPILDEAGIAHFDDEELIISREIHATGKSRAFISGQIVPAAFLQKIAPFLIDFISQHGSVLIKSDEEQRNLLDLYTSISLSKFQTLWENEKELEKALKTLEETREKSKIRKDQILAQLEELQESDIKKGEDESHFEEYTLLANAVELQNNSTLALSHGQQATEQIASILKILEKMSRYDQSLAAAQTLAKDSHFQLAELIETLQSFLGRLEGDPGRLAYLEERLKQIDHLKKKYGKELTTYQETIEKELDFIENLDDRVEEARAKLKSAKEATTLECEALNAQRRKGAHSLQTLLSKSLQELNIPDAQLTIHIEKAPRSRSGEDAVIFYLRANKGEASVPVKEKSSGGELSRLLFSLKVLLSEKHSPATMVFDEIDANVGGETATIIGQKLKALGLKRQILMITHFPQVASQGDHHIAVTKKEVNGRTTSTIELLDSCSKEAELLRMLGGKVIFP